MNVLASSRRLAFWVITIFFVTPLPRPALADNRPNIVLIVADDLGYGDLECYGSELNSTPNLNRLARQGMRFTDFHSNGPMCSATRAALLTGCYQHRFGRRFEGALGPERTNENGLPLAATTIAELLGRGGYSTAMFGKWHLGYNTTVWPTRQGFDRFVGLGSGDGDHHTQIDRQGEPDWWFGNRLQAEEGYTTDLITRHSVEFIRQHRGRRFFLFVSHLAIHFPWQGPSDPPQRQTGINYATDKWGILPDRRNVAPHVKAMIAALDASVGRIVDELESLQLSQNTLVFFCSDNGGYLRYADSHFNISSNGPLKGQKGELAEGGHRVPAIASWPGKIQPGTECDATLMTMDLFPTFARFADISLPRQQHIDGHSIESVLAGHSTEQLEQRTTFWRNAEAGAVRHGPWKLTLIDGRPQALYHLGNDLGETVDVSNTNGERVKQLHERWQSWELDIARGFTRRSTSAAVE